jgi:hypothetical protein
MSIGLLVLFVEYICDLLILQKLLQRVSLASQVLLDNLENFKKDLIAIFLVELLQHVIIFFALNFERACAFFLESE